MSGKGSSRRPTQISEQDNEDNWNRIFGKKKESKPVKDSQKEDKNGCTIKTETPTGN